MKNKNEVAYNPFRDISVHEDRNHTNEVENKISHLINPFKNPKNLNEASVLYEGNRYRMLKLLKKAEKGEKINLITLGGSITEGSGRSEGEYYGDLLNRWFKKRFLNNNINYINCGRGTTTSLFGCSRVERDIASLNPDLIIVEYAVNDTILKKSVAAETFEALLIKLLSLESQPCVFVLFSCLGELGSTQNINCPIGIHYQVPMASFENALKFHLKEKFGTCDLKRTDVIPENYIIDNFIFDGCHPNTYGYSLLCDFITFQFENAISNSNLVESSFSLPSSAYTSKRFLTSRISNSEVLNVTENTGWQPDDKETPYRQRGYKSFLPESKITFSFNCKILTLVSRRSISPRTGIISVKIDDKEPFTVDGYFHNGWGTYNDYLIIIDENEIKNHTVTVTFLNKKTEIAVEKAKELEIPENEIASKFVIAEFLEA